MNERLSRANQHKCEGITVQPDSRNSQQRQVRRNQFQRLNMAAQQIQSQTNFQSFVNNETQPYLQSNKYSNPLPDSYNDFTQLNHNQKINNKGGPNTTPIEQNPQRRAQAPSNLKKPHENQQNQVFLNLSSQNSGSSQNERPSNFQQWEQSQENPSPQERFNQGALCDSSQIWASFNLRNGVYIRPNSPNHNIDNISKLTNRTQRLSDSSSRNSTNNQFNPTASASQRLNNTLNSFNGTEEEKKDPSPTPIEEFKLNFRQGRQGFSHQSQRVSRVDNGLRDSTQTSHFVPPPSSNRLSPSVNSSPSEATLDQQEVSLHQHNSAPLGSSIRDEVWSNNSMHLTGATTNTVGSTNVGSSFLYITPSETSTINHANNQLNLTQTQRPPPPSPLKTEEDSTSLNISQQNIIVNDSQLQQQQQVSSEHQGLSSFQFNDSPSLLHTPSLAQSVYKEVLEHQQRSNQSALKGFEQVLEENQQLRQRMQQMESEMTSLRLHNQELQRIVQDYQRDHPSNQDASQSPNGCQRGIRQQNRINSNLQSAARQGNRRLELQEEEKHPAP